MTLAKKKEKEKGTTGTEVGWRRLVSSFAPVTKIRNKSAKCRFVRCSIIRAVKEEEEEEEERKKKKQLSRARICPSNYCTVFTKQNRVKCVQQQLK